MNELSLMINPRPNILTTADLAQLTSHIIKDIPKRVDFYNSYPSDSLLKRHIHVRVLLEDFTEPHQALDVMSAFGEAVCTALNAVTGRRVKARTGSDGYQVDLEIIVMDEAA